MPVTTNGFTPKEQGLYEAVLKSCKKDIQFDAPNFVGVYVNNDGKLSSYRLKKYQYGQLVECIKNDDIGLFNFMYQTIYELTP